MSNFDTLERIIFRPEIENLILNIKNGIYGEQLKNAIFYKNESDSESEESEEEYSESFPNDEEEVECQRSKEYSDHIDQDLNYNVVKDQFDEMINIIKTNYPTLKMSDFKKFVNSLNFELEKYEN